MLEPDALLARKRRIDAERKAKAIKREADAAAARKRESLRAIHRGPGANVLKGKAAE